MRLIDADKLKQDVLDWQDCYNGFSDTYDKAMIIDEIDAQPTIDAEPVRHGHWIFEEYPDGYYHSQCSLCNSWFVGDAFLNPYNYCPNCGAKMDKEDL